MDQGGLVSDELMVNIVRERLERTDAQNGFILDGFPRTVGQAIALDQIMNGRPLVVIDIEVPEAELIRRLSHRMVCEVCGATAGPDGNGSGRCQRCNGRLVQRSDDNDTVVRNRLKVYHQDTEPLKQYYRGRPSFRTIDGAQPPERVASQIEAALRAAVAGAKVGEGTTP
jgi:adenylate kinase